MLKHVIWRTGAALTLLAVPASGHVELDDPNGGEVLEAGSTYTIIWHVAVPHEVENWDLWYSVTGPEGPWIEIAMDLPAGDPSAGAEHTYAWVVPENASNQVRIQVRQDNVNQDYYDYSEQDLQIVLPCAGDFDGDGLVDAFDLSVVLGSWGPCASCDADLNDDGLVDGFDLAEFLGSWGPCAE